MNDLLSSLRSALEASGRTEPPELHLQAVSSQAGSELVPRLLEAIDRASGWVLQRHMTSASSLRMCVEAQGRALFDVYASLLKEGLHLDQTSHRLLTEHCSLVHLHRQARSNIFTLYLKIALPCETDGAVPWRRACTA